MDTGHRWREVREMSVVPDEVAVQHLFDDLTAGQPDPPRDRHSEIKRRVVRHRVAQAAGTLAVVAAAAAVAIGLGTSAGGLGPLTTRRPVPAWALPWPDHRDGSVPQRVLDGAVSAWRHLSALGNGTPLSVRSTSRVIWYVGQTAASGQVVVVIFEVHTSAGRRLVAGWATASEVMHGQSAWKPGSSPWVLYDVAAPQAARDLFIGLNVHGTAAQQDRNPDNWIVVLTAPRVQDVGWTAPGPSSTTTTRQGTSSSGSEAVGMASAVAGLAITDSGQITGRVQVTQLLAHRHNVLARPGYVGVPGSAASQTPQLAAPGQIPSRPGFVGFFEITGQGATSSDLTGISGRLAVRARCYGPGPLRIRFGVGSANALLGISPRAARGKLRSLGTIACDNGVHGLVTSIRLTSGHDRGVLIVNGSQTTAYRVGLGTAP
jgi:hypothetical protein